METIIQQSLTPNTCEMLEKRFANFLDSLGEAGNQSLASNWDQIVLPALQCAATPLGTFSFEVTEADRRPLEEGWKTTENRREGKPGHFSFTYAAVQKKGEGGIGGFEFRDRAKTRGCGGTDMDAIALARHLTMYPAVANKVKNLTFVFLESEIESLDGGHGLACVYLNDDLWTVGRGFLEGSLLSREYRPVLLCTPAAAGK